MSEGTIQRVAVITGASRGIGEYSARQMAARGRRVVLLARSLGRLEEICEDINQAGGSATCHACDVTDHDNLKALFEKIAADEGRLDVLVNNAGVTRDNLLLRMSDEEFDVVHHTNLRSAFVTCRAAVRSMMRNRFGRIVNIASVAGVVGNMGQTNYAAAKSGLIGMTKSIAKEMATKGITANVVAPGFVDTAMTRDLPEPVKQFAINSTPLRRFGQPEEVASAITFLCSDEAAYVTGQVLAVDGGMTMS